MSSIYATVRSFYFKLPGKEKYQDLCSPVLSCRNGAELIKQFIQSCQNFQTETDKEYTFRFEEVWDNLDKGDSQPYYYIFGKVYTGQYGREGDVINIDNGTVEFEVKKNHAEILPFGFVVLIQKQPRRKDGEVHKGLVVFEVNRGSSVRVRFFRHFRRFLRQTMNDYNREHEDAPQRLFLKDSAVADADAMKAIWEKSNLEKITLIKNKQSLDGADEGSDIIEAKEKREYCRPVLRTETLLRLEERFVDGGVFQLQTKDKFDYDDITVTLEDKVSQRSRVFRLGGVDKIQIMELMPDGCIGEDGHPKDKEALDFYCDIGMLYMNRMALDIK